MGLISPTILRRSPIVKLPSMREGSLGFQSGCLEIKEFGSPSRRPKNTSPTMRPPICPSLAPPCSGVRDLVRRSRLRDRVVD